MVKIASQKLRDFFDDKIELEKVFDLGKWAAYFAVMDMSQNYHGAFLKSVKFYYNPLNGLFEPIPFDGHRFKHNYHKYHLNYDNRILIDFVEPDMALNENKDATDFEENNVQIETIDIPEFKIGSNELSTIEKNFEKIPNRDFLNTEFYLLIGFILLLAFLLILRNRPAKNETKTLKNDEELKNDLDEEFGEI